MKTAIFPGSFDPLHNGHVALAQTAADQLQLDQVIFVPSGVSPNKRRTQKTPGKTRFDWIQTALAELGDPRLTVSDIESRHSVTTYTLETVQELGKGIPKSQLFLLVGADTAERMKRWPSYQKVLATATVVTFGRDKQPGSIDAPEWPHASSEIKRLIQSGKDIRHLVPTSIAKEITQHFQNHEPV